MSSIEAPVVPDERGEERARGQEGRVRPRRGLEVAVEHDAAGDHEEAAEQDDERHVVERGVDEGLRVVRAGRARARAAPSTAHDPSLRRFDSQKCGAARGRTAMASSRPAKGSAQAAAGTKASAVHEVRTV